MTTPHNFTINTRWGHTYHKTSTLNLDPKLLTPTETSLFDLLPTDILMYIDIVFTSFYSIIILKQRINSYLTQ